jgi:hypothetical protein
MKKIVAIFVSALLFLGVIACLACCGAGNKITVKFVQNGQETIVKELEKGGTLTDIPTPKAKSGYTIVWDKTAFFNLQEGLTVTAVETPNTYVITYELNNRSATIEAATQTVTYDTEVVLFTPQSNSEKIAFKGWIEQKSGTAFKSGVYKTAENITLVAEWEILGGGEWSDNK